MLFLGVLSAIFSAGFAQDYSEDAALGGGIVDLGRSAGDVEGVIKPWQTRRSGLAGDLDGSLQKMAEKTFREREEGTRELLGLLRVSAPELGALVDDRKASLEDPEILNRLHWAREQDLGDPLLRLRGALEWIRVQRLTALLPAFEKVLPFNLDEGLEQQLVATTRELTQLTPDIPADHLALLRRWRSHDRDAFRMAAAVSLVAAADLEPLLDDVDERVALAAGIGTARHGAESAITKLKTLAKSEDAFVARRAAWALRTLKADPDLSLPHGVVSAADPADGRGLVLAGGQFAEVRRLAPNGQLVKKWAFPDLDFVGDIIPMAKGQFVISAKEDWRRSALIGIDRKGEELWRVKSGDYECPNLLSNGHLLLASDDQVRELDAKRKEIWSVELHGEDGRMAWRMTTGTTLVAMRRQVQEFDRGGKVVWEMDFPEDYVVSCQGLQNGNRFFILKNSNRAIEVNEDKDIVWEWKAPNGVSLWDGFRMGNGNLLTKTDSGALEVSYGKQLLWKMDFGQAGHVRRM